MRAADRASARRTRAACFVAAFALACTTSDSGADATGDANAGAAGDTVAAVRGSGEPRAGSRTDSAAPGPARPWYERTHLIDLTGDGVADTARLTARGTRPDSMQIRMALVVDGEEKFREGWGSSYELSLLDSAARRSARVDELLRARLDTVLASIRVEPLEGRIPGVMAEDSAVLKTVSPWPKDRIIFSYGYESQPNLFWDAPRKRFVRLWSCC